MSQQLIPQQEQSLALAEGYIPVAGFENLSPDDFSLPTLKLVQAQTTTDNAMQHLGQYVKTDTGEYFENPAALIVGIAKSRIMFPPEYSGKGSEPLCRSDNAIHPRVDYIGRYVDGLEIPDQCAQCPFAQFPEYGGAPPCSLSENWAAILDSGDIVIVRFKGASTRASGMLKNIMRANRMKQKPTYVRLGSQFQKGEKGQFYTSTITQLGQPPATSLELAGQLVGINLAARAADELPEQRASEPAGEDTEIPF